MAALQGHQARTLILTIDLTHAQIQELLLDPECPYGMYWEQLRGESWDDLRTGEARRRRTTKPIEVEALKGFARERYGDDPQLELKLDRVIREVAGERLRVIDVWSWPRRAMRRLAGKPQPTGDVYEIPEAFFDEEAHFEANGETTE